ncbi:MAG: hypothetical protein IJS45_09485 [Clostridia bacterium]|nr:hypothetical protein [Clostridia bacterium]
MKKAIIFILLLALALAAAVPAYAADKDKYLSLSLTDDELTLVAKALAAETAGKNYLTKTCVAAMLFNRMADGVLKRSAHDAVYESGALLFADGDAIDSVDTEDGAFEEYLYLARIVYKYGIDPTCGALFCFTEDDPDAGCFTVTIKTDGLIFASP